jgi:hypothetical protein
MHSRHLFLALLACAQVHAIPLNINLGAYSPALVVGDGEISFGGAQNAAELMETLASGAAANAANAQNNEQPQAQPEATEQNGQQPKQRVPATGETPPPEDATAATDNADDDIAQAIRKGIVVGEPNLAKRDVISELETGTLDEARILKIKRDIAGFREALAFARDAQKNQPAVELGTEKAGVGILVRPGINVPTNSAANGVVTGPTGARAKAKRVDEPQSEQKHGITLLAIAEI